MKTGNHILAFFNFHSVLSHTLALMMMLPSVSMGQFQFFFRGFSSSVDTVHNAPTTIGTTATFTFKSFWILMNEQVLLICFSSVCCIPSWLHVLARGKGKSVIKHSLSSLYITITSGRWCHIALRVFEGKSRKMLQCLFSITDSSPVSTCLHKLGSKSYIRTNESFFPVTTFSLLIWYIGHIFSFLSAKRTLLSMF